MSRFVAIVANGYQKLACACLCLRHICVESFVLIDWLAFGATTVGDFLRLEIIFSQKRFKVRVIIERWPARRDLL